MSNFFLRFPGIRDNESTVLSWHIFSFFFQLKGAREKLGRPCDMCNNYEAQLQNVQETFKAEQTKVRSLDRTIQSVKQESESQKQYIEKLEDSLKENVDNANKEVRARG